MKKYFLCLITFLNLLSNKSTIAQSTGINYSFTQPVGSMIYNNSTLGAVSLIPGGTDDADASFIPPATWSGFYYGGNWIPPGTSITVSSNGWISLFNQGGSIPQNSLATTPLMIAPLWDDLKIHSDGEVSYQVSGGVGSRELVIEWRGMVWDHNATDSALSFQAVIYDNAQTNISMRNVIEFRYKRNGTDATYINNSSGGASIGISGLCAGDVYAFTSSTGAPDKTSPENSSIALKPSDVIVHRFTPEVHPNDECISAELIYFDSSLPWTSVPASTLHSTQSAGSLPICGSPATVSDVWFTFTKPAGITNFEIFTDTLDCRGINFTTGLEIFTACGNASLACDFGSPGPVGTNATSYLNVVSQTCNAQQYLVRAYSTDTLYRGYFKFNLRPPGSICENANDITSCGLPYTSIPGLNTCLFGNDYDSSNSVPHLPFSFGEDYIFSFTPPADICVDVSLITPPGTSPGLFLSLGWPSFGSNIASAIGDGVNPIGFNNIALLAGNTYYFVIDNNTWCGVYCLQSFEFSVSQSSSITPVIDDCAAAQNIPVEPSAKCTGAIDFHNNCAMPSPVGTVPLPGCGLFIDGVTPDVWLTFTSTGSNPHVIQIDPGSIPSAEDLAMAVYSGTCGNLSLVACDDNSNGIMPALPVIPPAAGTIYYVRVFSNGGTHPGNFRICIVDGCSAVNDSCATAIPLEQGQYTLGDNSCATGINEPGSASCWSNQSALQRNTVWYSFVATSDSMKIRVHLLSLFDSQIALYESTGPCTGLNQIFCNDNSISSCGNSDRYSEINATGLVVGNTYYICVDGRQSNTGTFEIIVQAATIPFPALYAQDCPLAIPLCTNNTITVSNPVYMGNGNICDIAQNTTCLLSGETNSVFYTFGVTGTGAGTPVEFTITSNGFSNCDFMLWCIDTVHNGGDQIPAVPNYCDNLSNTSMFPSVLCNYSFQGITGCSAAAGLCNMICYQDYAYNGTGMMPAVVVPDGMTATFLLLVNNNVPAGFTLDWMGTPLGSIPPSLVWTGGSSSDWNDSANWNQGACGIIPDCNNQIRTVIAPGNNIPVLFSNVSVSDIVISPGASLLMLPGATLSVCGNFMNYGQLNCALGSTVKFLGNRNTVIDGVSIPFFNSFPNIEVAKSSGATLTLQTDLYVRENDSIYGGILNTNGNDIYIGGNFYNYNGNNSYITLNSSNLQFTGLGSLSQHFRNDSTPLILADVSMLQAMIGSLTLDTNATSDLIVNGSLYLGAGIIKTGPQRKVEITNNQPAACSPGFAMSYIEGNLTRSIAQTTGFYEFPVGDSLKGYQQFVVEFVTAPSSGYRIAAKFNQWNGLPLSPTAAECSNSGWDLLPVFDQGYWTLDASIVLGVGKYTAHAFPGAVTNNSGLTFSIMKAPSNSGQGPWTMEGVPYCPSTSTHVQRDSLSSFSDFAVVQSDIGNSIYTSSTGESFFTVIPNPAKGKATVYFDNSSGENFIVSMVDLTGRTVLRSATTNNFLELNLDGIDRGIYLLDVNNQNHSAFLKLIVQ